MEKKYLVGIGIEKTIEAETAPMAIRKFIDWLQTVEGNACITAIEKEKSFKPKGG